MKIAITSHGQDKESAVDTRFGRAEYFLLHDTDSNSWECYPNHQSLTAAHGAGIQAAQHVLSLGAEVLITGHVGPKAFRVLQTGGVGIYSIGESTSSLQADAVPGLFESGKLTQITVPNAIDMKR